MKKEKIVLSSEDLKLGPAALGKKYNFSRGHAHYVLQKGYFWRNWLVTPENLSPVWVEENIEKIQRVVRTAFWIKVRQKGIARYPLFNEYKNDIIQDAILYVIKRAGEVKDDKSLFSISFVGIDLSIQRLFFHGDGKNAISKSDYFDNHQLSSPEEEDEFNLDTMYLQVKEIISSQGEESWKKVWTWATSRSSRCPEDVLSIFKAATL